MLYDGKTAHVLSGQRINTTNTHGTGCTTASAIAAELAKGATVLSAARAAKTYVERGAAQQRCAADRQRQPAPLQPWVCTLHLLAFDSLKAVGPGSSKVKGYPVRALTMAAVLCVAGHVVYQVGMGWEPRDACSCFPLTDASGVSSEEAWIQPELCHAGMQQLTG